MTNHTDYKPQRSLTAIDPLSFHDVRARVDFGGVCLKVKDGFLLPDEAEALHQWLTKALAKPDCKHKPIKIGGGRSRCKVCRVDL